jgi:hypothetical protein
MAKRLDREPLASEMKRYRRQTGQTYRGLAEEAGLNERTLRRIATGESRHADLNSADKLTIAMQRSLSELYPE